MGFGLSIGKNEDLSFSFRVNGGVSQVDVFDGVLAPAIQVGDALADVFGLSVFLPVEFMPSEVFGVFGWIPFVRDVHGFDAAVHYRKDVSGLFGPFDVDLPEFASHFIEVVSLDLAHLHANDAVGG